MEESLKKVIYRQLVFMCGPNVQFTAACRLRIIIEAIDENWYLMFT